MSDTAPDIVFFLCRESSAMVFAYLDANIATVVFQTVVAAAITVPIILRTQVGQFIARLRGQKESPDLADPNERSTQD